MKYKKRERCVVLGRLFNLFLGDTDYSKWNVQKDVLVSGRGTRTMLFYDKDLKRQVSLVDDGKELLKETEDLIIHIIDMGYCKQDGGNCGTGKLFHSI